MNPGHRIDKFYTCLMTSLAECDSVLELGCGVGDKLARTPCSLRVGVDAFRPYIDMAVRKWGPRLHELHLAEAVEYMAQEVRVFDAILLIDFIEHLTKDAGIQLLDRCRFSARRKVIVFCPLGECKQDKDTYSLGGDHWQTHRSTWSVADLSELGFDVAQWPGYRDDGGLSAFAVWSRND